MKEGAEGCKPHHQDTGPIHSGLQRAKVNPCNMFSAPPIRGTHDAIRSDFSTGTFNLLEEIGHAHTHTCMNTQIQRWVGSM